MLANVVTVAFEGVDARRVDVQVQQLPSGDTASFTIVGLADKAVAESRERVRGAFGGIGLALPPKRIIVNMAPADLPKEGSHNLVSLLELFEQAFREPFMVQRYLPEVRKGDKRIIIVDGRAVGAINRVPAAGESRSNMHVGGKAEKSALTKREKEICEAIGPALAERGLIFVGIDVIGDYLTEINVTSPTGIREIKRFGGPDIAVMIWDAIEKRRA